MLGLFQKLSSGGATFFFRPLHPQDTHGVRAPRPPGHVSALINPPHYGSNMPWPPGQVTPHPPPLGHTVNKTPSPHRTKKCLRPTHPLRIISGTALNGLLFRYGDTDGGHYQGACCFRVWFGFVFTTGSMSVRRHRYICTWSYEPRKGHSLQHWKVRNKSPKASPAKGVEHGAADMTAAHTTPALLLQ